MKRKTEFEKFDALMQKLIKVPHSTIKAKLDAEKQGKSGSLRGLPLRATFQTKRIRRSRRLPPCQLVRHR
jgi:hypothetical protein